MSQATAVLAHYGVKGMRWGVRKDRSERDVEVFKRAGKKVKTKGGNYKGPSDDAVRAAIARQTAKKSTTDSLSNKELQDLVTRMNLERQYKQLAGEQMGVGQRITRTIIGEVGDQNASVLGAAAGSRIGLAVGNPVAGAAAGVAVGTAVRTVAGVVKPGSKKK